MTDLSLYTVGQKFDRPRCLDIKATVTGQIRRCSTDLKPGSSIAVAVGSRGIANIGTIVKATVDALNSLGARPFIVPAMGSHGGATAGGQQKVLEDAGITERSVGAPVRSSMDVIELSSGDTGNRIFMDKNAAEADGIVLVNRIKPHTDFHGRFESGLVKMGVIGLGKHAGALEIHSFGVAGLRERIPKTFEKILSTGKILCGLAVVENAYDETAFIETVSADRILAREPELLDIARANMPRLPVQDIDVLLVDRLGKEISGVGMDPNIIGRIRIAGEPEPSSPRIKTIVVSSLSPHSYGNALGIGLADVITRRLYDAIDFEAMYVNVRASLFLERIKVPYIAPDDAEGFAIAAKACGAISPDSLRVVRIADTLNLGTIQVSQSVYDEIRNDVNLIRNPSVVFDERGYSLPIER